MKFKSKLFVSEYAHDAYNMPDYDSVEIEFNEDQDVLLNLLLITAKEVQGIDSIVANFAPTVTPLLNGEVVDIGGTDWDLALQKCFVSVFAYGMVHVSFETDDADQKSWVDSFKLNA